MAGTDTADQVPGRFDVLIDGFGYVTARAVDPNFPFRVQQQSLSYTPTFLERTNVSGNYGDESQAFFLTASQDDWSAGEDQRFFRGQDADSVRRYWLGSNIDITVPGQATLRPAVTSLSLAATVSNATGIVFSSMFTASATNLYEISTTGTVTDRGAHGCGGLADAICTDGLYLYLSGAACTKVRRYNMTTHAFADFGVNVAARSLTFLNNSLWGAGVLGQNVSYYDSTGTPTAAFTWKDATGTGLAVPTTIVPFGGKLAALLPAFLNVSGAELWIADNNGAQRIAEFPITFQEKGLVEALGLLFVAGCETSPTLGCRTAIYYWNAGTLNRLWISRNWNSSFASAGVGIAKYRDGLLFTDIANSVIRYYDFGTGGSSVVAAYTPSAQNTFIAANDKAAILTQATATTTFFPSNAATATTGSIKTSLFDFDNSLSKLLRGIKVDFSPATDGDGGSVDIAYQGDSLDGAYTNLRTAAVSGTEYTLTGVSGHSISARITLNKGTSTLGPTLKRVYVRGVPVLTTYRINEYILDLGGDTTSQNPVVLRDGRTPHPLNGEQMRAHLVTALTSPTPITVTDRSGTFTAVLEPANCEFDLTRPGQWYARIRVREV